MNSVSSAHSSQCREEPVGTVASGIFRLLALGLTLRRTFREGWREQRIEPCPQGEELDPGKQLRSEIPTTATHSHAYNHTLTIPAAHPQSRLYQTPRPGSQTQPLSSRCFPCSTKERENRACYPWRGAPSSQVPFDHLQIGKRSFCTFTGTKTQHTIYTLILVLCLFHICPECSWRLFCGPCTALGPGKPSCFS